MTETDKSAQVPHIIEEVRKFSVFADLPEEDLRWLAERMDEFTLEDRFTRGRATRSII